MEFIVMLIPVSLLRRMFAICLLSSFTIVACGQSAYRNIEVVEQTPSSEMFDALITDDDILSATGKTRQPELGYMESTEDWRWSNPITVVEAKQNYIGPLTHTIAEYSSPEIARSVWWSLRRTKLEDSVTNWVTKAVDLLPAEGRPSLSADDTRWRCERYYDEISWSYCVAQLRYGHFYIEIIGEVSRAALSPQQFFDLVDLADQRMQVLISIEQKSQ